MFFCPCQARSRKHQPPLEMEASVLTVGLWDVVSELGKGEGIREGLVPADSLALCSLPEP